MGLTVAETIRSCTREHLLENKGLLFGQCVTAVGWVGGTIPEMTEEDGIVELSMADVANAGIVTGAGLMNRRPIYVIRYQGFMWYNAAPLLNYAAKSKEMWGVPCPILVRSIAMEGAIGPVASSSHHGMVMRMPGMPIFAPMTPKEWLEGWKWFMEHDDPLYMSEHRKSYQLQDEYHDEIYDDAVITIFAISYARLSAIDAVKKLKEDGIVANLIHIKWIKPFEVTKKIIETLNKTKYGIVIDSDYQLCGASQSIAHTLMMNTNAKVHALGIEDKTSGFAPHLDVGTPKAEEIYSYVKNRIINGAKYDIRN
jgi:acetoin:2,6-dichlorophenolindophenol oxidoreductase subunit beta